MVDFEIEDNCYVNDKFIGTTVSKKITVNILNPDNSINLENKEIVVNTGIVINGEEELVSFGNFIIEKPTTEETKEKTKFTGYDYMIKFNKKYEDLVEYPITLQEYLAKLCEQVGIELGSTNIVNGTYEIQGNPFTNNEDCKTVLSNVAQLCGGFAHIGRNNKLYITNLTNGSVETIDGNNYTSFEKNEQYGEVNSVILRLSQVEGENTVKEDTESIELNGLTEITIADNYFLNNAEEREKVIDAIFNQLDGLRYIPITCSYYGFPYLDSGDAIIALDIKDVDCPTYIFNHKFKYNGAFSGEIETPAMTKTQTAYKNIVDIKTRFQNVELKVDKINGNITSIVEETTNLETKVQETETLANNNYQDIINQLGDYAKEADVVSIKESVEASQTNSELAIEIAKQVQTDGVTRLDTKTGYTFNEEGLTIEKTNAKTKTTLNEVGLDVKDATGSSDESLLFAGYDEESGETIVKSKNMTVEKYLVIGKYSRMEDFIVDGVKATGVFWING